MIETLKKYILYFLVGIAICLVGITGVFADTYNANQFSAWLYDNYGPTLSYVTTDFTNNRWQGTIPTMVANSSGGAWGVSSPVLLLANHTYALTAKITGPFAGSVILSTYNRVGVGNTINNAVSSYQNDTNVVENYSAISNSSIQLAFTPDINGNFIVFAFSNTITANNQTFWLENFIIDDLGSASSVSQTTINNSLNYQTSVLQNSLQSTETNIINNNDENTQRIIDENNKNFNTCSKQKWFINDIVMGDYTNQNKTIRASSRNSIYLEEGTYNFTTDLNLSTYGVALDILPNVPPSSTFNSIQGFGYVSSSNSQIVVSQSGYLVLTFRKNGNLTFTLDNILNYNYVLESDTETCINKLDEQTNAIKGLDDTINDDDTDGATSDASDFFSDFTTDTFGLTSIITAPLNLIQSLTSSTCTDLELPLPYLDNKKLTLPCMTSIYSTYFGTFFTLYQTITYGIIAYWVCVRIFNLVKDFKNPEHDEIEVVDL